MQHLASNVTGVVVSVDHLFKCWCAEETDLTRNGEVLASDECDMLCMGTTSVEHCGGYSKMTAYEIQKQLVVGPGYVGCYADWPVPCDGCRGKIRSR